MNDSDRLLNEYLKSNRGIEDVISQASPKPKIAKEMIMEKLETTEEEETSLTENAIIEEKIIEKPKEIVKEVEKKVIIEKEVIPNETLVILLNEVKDLKSDLEMMKEAIVEILNKSLQSDKLFREKLTTPSSQGRKKIILNRDESGKIVSAEAVEINEGN